MANDDACKIRIFESLRGQMESSDFRQTVLIPTLITGPKKALSPPPILLSLSHPSCQQL